MKRILKINIYKSGDLTHEVTDLVDVNKVVSGNRAVFTGHATVKSRFKNLDFSSLYRLTKVYEREQGGWRVIASKTARLAEN